MRQSADFIENRKKEMVEYLTQHNAASVGELAARFSISESTVRKQLQRLAEEGLVVRTYGGAQIPVQPEPLRAFLQPNTNHYAEKVCIAHKARKLVEDGDAIAIGCGSTTWLFAKTLHDLQDLTVITDSLFVAVELAGEPGIEVRLTGGIVHKSSSITYDDRAVAFLSSVSVDKVFISVEGISLRSRSVTAMSHLNAVERGIFCCGQHVYVLADHSKFENATVVERLATFDEIDRLITDDNIPPELLKLAVSAGLTFYS